MSIYTPLPPFERCERLHIPVEVFRAVWARQEGRCCDCRGDLTKLAFDKDHDPPLALRPKGSNPNDPEKIFLRCETCHDKKTDGDKHRPRSGDKGKIAHAKAARKTQDAFLDRMAKKVCGQKREKTGSIKSRGFEKGHRPLRSRGFQKRIP